jgi:hypothetical protein
VHVTAKPRKVRHHAKVVHGNVTTVQFDDGGGEHGDARDQLHVGERQDKGEERAPDPVDAGFDALRPEDEIDEWGADASAHAALDQVEGLIWREQSRLVAQYPNPGNIWVSRECSIVPTPSHRVGF